MVVIDRTILPLNRLISCVVLHQSKGRLAVEWLKIICMKGFKVSSKVSLIRYKPREIKLLDILHYWYIKPVILTSISCTNNRAFCPDYLHTVPCNTKTPTAMPHASMSFLTNGKGCIDTKMIPVVHRGTRIAITWGSLLISYVWEM